MLNLNDFIINKNGRKAVIVFIETIETNKRTIKKYVAKYIDADNNYIHFNSNRLNKSIFPLIKNKERRFIMTRDEAIMEAWNKISKYVKDNYTNKFEKGVSFTWKHKVYYWIKFGVTPDGIAYITKGNHSSSIPTEYCYHPEKEDTQLVNIKKSMTEEVVDDWLIIKEKLKMLAEKEYSLYNFKV